MCIANVSLGGPAVRSPVWRACLNGVELDFSWPGKPMDNTFIEAFNGRFRKERLNENWYLSLEDAAEKVESWRRHYNGERPHSALGNLSPGSLPYWHKRRIDPQNSQSGWHRKWSETIAVYRYRLDRLYVTVGFHDHRLRFDLVCPPAVVHHQLLGVPGLGENILHRLVLVLLSVLDFLAKAAVVAVGR